MVFRSITFAIPNLARLDLPRRIAAWICAKGRIVDFALVLFHIVAVGYVVDPTIEVSC